MKSRTRTQLVAGVVVAVFAIGLWTTGVAVQAGWLRFYSLAVLVAGGAWAAWDRWIWRAPIFKRMESVPPVMFGTWKGELTSLWIDPATGSRPAPKPAFLVIRQTASSVDSVVLFTDESRSRSTLASVDPRPGVATLTYTYMSKPDITVEHRSRIHHGAVVLDITGSPATRLRGRYWTDRDSRGELHFTERREQHAGDYDEAARMFAKA